MTILSNSELLVLTRLPGLPAALHEIPVLASRPDGTTLGVIVFVLHPDAASHRLSPESSMRVCQEVTHRLREQLREGDRLYSISPSEWLIVLPGLRSSATLTLAMLKFQRVFEVRVLTVDGITLRPSISCGAAIRPEDGDEALYLVQSARIAAWHAHQHGRVTALYELGMEEFNEHLKDFERELRIAFSGDSGLQLYLQPQVEAASGCCIGAEGLLRWRRGNGEWVSPPEVLAAIDRLGLRQRFNRWLFFTAGQICHKLRAAAIDIRLSINLSANDLLDPEVPDLLDQALKLWNVAPQLIRLEITETSMVQDTEAVVDVLQRLRGLGASLSIDDFGTGYSGMSYLKTLPVQEVKIDQSFVRNIAESKHDQEIAGSIISLSHRLGLQVIAEGVETRESAELLNAMGCEYLQGFLYSPALPLDEFASWFKEHGAVDQG